MQAILHVLRLVLRLVKVVVVIEVHDVWLVEVLVHIDHALVGGFVQISTPHSVVYARNCSTPHS